MGHQSQLFNKELFFYNKMLTGTDERPLCSKSLCKKWEDKSCKKRMTPTFCRHIKVVAKLLNESVVY
jgi:hypothetical protein